MSDAPAEQPTPELPSTEFLSTHLDLRTRTIYVSHIEEGAADLFIKSMHLLMSVSEDPIHVIINSRGGSLIDALGMYDCIRSAGRIVTCEVFGHCMSAGVLIATCCDRRFIHPSAAVMVHNPIHSAEGDSYSFETWGKQAGRDRDRLHAILAKHTGKSKAFWRNRCAKGDFLMTSEQAVKLGLFDEVIQPDDKD